MRFSLWFWGSFFYQAKEKNHRILAGCLSALGLFGSLAQKSRAGGTMIKQSSDDQEPDSPLSLLFGFVGGVILSVAMMGLLYLEIALCAKQGLLQAARAWLFG